MITDPKFKAMTDRGIPADVRGFRMRTAILNSSSYLIRYLRERGRVSSEPQLDREMQGFPSTRSRHFTAAHGRIRQPAVRFSSPPERYTKDTYIADLKEIILGKHKPENVILLEIFPEQQKTRIDFYCTEQLIGIKMVCPTN